MGKNKLKAEAGHLNCFFNLEARKIEKKDTMHHCYHTLNTEIVASSEKP